MIILQDLFDTLAYGELSNLALGNSSTGSIVESEYPKIVSHINLGLMELYKRFPLKKGELKVIQQTNVDTYYLRSEFVGEYIEDNDNNPFEDDIIKVDAVFNEIGDELPLNNSHNINSVFTPAFDILKMVPSDPVQTVSVVYQARYPKIVVYPQFNPSHIELYIPDFIVEPLISYVAARIYKGMIALEGEANPNTSYMQQYELACKKIELYGLSANNNDSRDNKFISNGWV
jgi:hypothetical protein